MAKRLAHNHNVPTVSVKSNYNVDGNLDLKGDLRLEGKLFINGKEVNMEAGGMDISAGNGIIIENNKIHIDENFVASKNDVEVLSKKIDDLEDKIENGEGGTPGGSNCDCDLSEIEERLKSLETSGEIIDLHIESIKKDVEDLNDDIDDLNGDIDDLRRRLSNLESGGSSGGIDGYSYGNSYKSLKELYADKNNLREKVIYSVTDKNTIEEYIIKNGEIVQVSGGFNMQVSGTVSEEGNDDVSSKCEELIDENGEINYNMTELVNGDFLFKGCEKLKVFVSDTPSLTTARQMFYKCVNLETFCGVLSMLEDGYGMFGGCKLDEESILNIVDSINEFESLVNETGEERNITIGYNSDLIDGGLIEEFTAEFNQKGWTVDWIPSTN